MAPPLRIIVFNAVLLCACLYALRRGGQPERWTAWMMVVAAVLTALRPVLTPVRYDVVNPVVLAIDLAFLLGITLIALRANRFWVMWAAAIQLVSIGIHITRALDPTILPVVYNQALGKFAYPTILLLAVGTYRHFRRSQRSEEADWSPLRW